MVIGLYSLSYLFFRQTQTKETTVKRKKSDTAPWSTMTSQTHPTSGRVTTGMDGMVTMGTMGGRVTMDIMAGMVIMDTMGGRVTGHHGWKSPWIPQVVGSP